MKGSCFSCLHLPRKARTSPGEAIINKALERNLELLQLESFEAIPGHGVQVEVQGKKLLLGNKKLMDDRNIPITLQEDSDRLAEEGKTPCLLPLTANLQVS